MDGLDVLLSKKYICLLVYAQNRKGIEESGNTGCLSGTGWLENRVGRRFTHALSYILILNNVIIDPIHYDFLKNTNGNGGTESNDRKEELTELEY